jgi:hypothetical protein
MMTIPRGRPIPRAIFDKVSRDCDRVFGGVVEDVFAVLDVDDAETEVKDIGFCHSDGRPAPFNSIGDSAPLSSNYHRHKW